jgi:serine/threonine-protein kinase
VAGTGWDLKRGQEVVPGCTVISLLGGGHAYESYRAQDEDMLAPVVVKIVRPHLVDDSSTLRGLRREVDLLERLNHPVIVRGFHALVDGPKPYLAMESLDGPRLSTLIRKFGPLPMEQLLPLGLEMCSGLHYMRHSGVVHLDVKPSNIIMGAPPRLIDLSIARDIDRAQALEYTVGTDAYLAPEQCEPPRFGKPGAPADMWGLGATMFEAVTGSRPFRTGVDDETAPATERWPQLVEPVADFPKQVPELVRRPIMACLDPDPAARPSPKELVELLLPLVEALPKPKLGGFRPRL